ncbi:MAG: hypothetical protein GXX10_13180 [Clostridiaceae bacterium]|nr:hypothetical protein [Clostridiaceae bacterium]
MRTSTSGRIVSIIVGAAVFAALNFMTALALPFTLIGGILGWLVTILLFSSDKSSGKIVYDGTTKSEIDSTIKAGRKLTNGMRVAVHRLTQTEIKNQVEELCRIAESMFEMLRKDPNDLRIVKQFISHYLEPTHKIIVKYAELATVRPMPADAVETLERTEKSLANIRATFLKQKERMLSNDVMDLDTEIKVFETLTKDIKINTNTDTSTSSR